MPLAQKLARFENLAAVAASCYPVLFLEPAVAGRTFFFFFLFFMEIATSATSGSTHSTRLAERR